VNLNKLRWLNDSNSRVLAPHDWLLSQFLYDSKRWVWKTSSIVLIKIVDVRSLGVWYFYPWVSHRMGRQMHLSSRVQWRYQNFEIEAVSIILLCCVVMLNLVPYIGHLSDGRTHCVPWRPAGGFECALNYVCTV